MVPESWGPYSVSRPSIITVVTSSCAASRTRSGSSVRCRDGYGVAFLGITTSVIGALGAGSRHSRTSLGFPYKTPQELVSIGERWV